MCSFIPNPTKLGSLQCEDSTCCPRITFTYIREFHDQLRNCFAFQKSCFLYPEGKTTVYIHTTIALITKV